MSGIITKMRSTMIYKKWDIVLVPFPFTNFETTKKRPALVISPDEYNSGADLVILFITSNVSTYSQTGDYLIENWNQSGLPKPSMTRMKFATIENSIVIKKIGRLHNNDRVSVENKIIEFFT